MDQLVQFPETTSQCARDLAATDDEEFLVEDVLNHKRTRSGLRFLIKWEGYPDPTWEPPENLKDNISYEDYLEAHPKLKKHIA